ncbi:hypothetical protein OIU84_004237 [Salix udensis]|uniref:Protein kinase domain-containing protein n=1 Tax=Salix udensis TaxID=889485 RepID=A0AAD6K3V1_9ROSI|nr:hypothetical protein OIU84_004237 [Salix udensis]
MKPPFLFFLLEFFFFFLSSPSLLVFSAATLPLPLQSLLSIKTFVKDPSNTFKDWNLSNSTRDLIKGPVWCSWSGIKCNPTTARVTSLDLSRRNLSGVIPAEIRYLTSLVHLNLSGNGFDGLLQSAIFELSDLRILDISHNNFNSTLPPGISKLKFLRVFNAYSNNFTGPLSNEFVSLRFLEELNLGGSYFTGEIPRSYGSFLRLKYLHLAGNELEGPLPPDLGFLSQLEHLELGYHPLLSGNVPEEFALLANLKYLDISKCNLSGNLPQQLGNLTKLENLLLFMNQFTGEIPVSYANLKALKALDLSVNQLSGTIPWGLSSLKDLNRLSLLKNQLTGEIPPGLGELPYLDTLELWNNNLTGFLPQKLGSSGNLLWLDVSNNSLSGPLPPNLCQGNKLYKLILFSNKFFGEIPDDLGKSEPLHFLNISENSFHAALPNNIWSAPNLQVFSASSCKLVSKIPDFIGCGSVYRIELQDNMLNGNIPWDIGHCERLISLNLRGNSLTGIIPWEISTLPAIADVDLSHNLLTGSIPSNFGNCSTLESFNVSYNLLTGPIPASGTVFSNIHPSSFSGNQGLCGGVLPKPCAADTLGAGEMEVRHRQQPKRTAGAIVWIMAAAFGIGLFVLVAGTRCFHANYSRRFSDEREIGPWKLTAFQRLNFTADDVLECLSMSDKILGMGSTGTVYKAEMPGGEIIAVKKLWGKHKENIRKRRGVLAEVDVLGNLIQSDESMSVIAGSYGYIAPEYAYTLQVDEKSDIYSYGVVLMEIISGKRSVDAAFGDGNSIVDWVRSKIKNKDGVDDILDKDAGAAIASVREEMLQMLRIALLCTSRNPADRPSMRDVVLMLQEAKPKRKLPGSTVSVGSGDRIATDDGAIAQKPAAEC